MDTLGKRMRKFLASEGAERKEQYGPLLTDGSCMGPFMVFIKSVVSLQLMYGFSGDFHPDPS